MSNLITAIPTGITAFTATNLDDILILMLFFSQVNAVFRRQHIVIVSCRLKLTVSQQSRLQMEATMLESMSRYLPIVPGTAYL